jgi:hypothetical protein
MRAGERLIVSGATRFIRANACRATGEDIAIVIDALLMPDHELRVLNLFCLPDEGGDLAALVAFLDGDFCRIAVQ